MIPSKALLLPGVVLLVAAGMASDSWAESTAEALKAFGLIGTWSADCSKDPTSGDPQIGRTTYKIRLLARPIARFAYSLQIGTPPVLVVVTGTAELRSAVRVTEDKIEMMEELVALSARTNTGVPVDPEVMRQLEANPAREAVLVKQKN